MNVKLSASAEGRTWVSSCAPFVYHNTDKEYFLLAIMSIMYREVYDNLPNVLLKKIEIMDNKVIFDVLCNVRYNVLGKIGLITPAEFSNLEHCSKDELYRKVFDAIHDSCDALQALMTLEKNYRQLESK